MYRDRIRRIESAVDALGLLEQELAHLKGTARICAELAEKQGENPELCYIAGFLHDMMLYLTGSTINHAHRSAAWAENTLRLLGCFEEEEIRIIHGAIYLHSDKTVVHGPMAEILKKADLLQKKEIETGKGK